MKLHEPSNAARKGFTLIELLVVIAIIAVLLGMLIVAVAPIFSKGPEVRARKEISAMSTAIITFDRDRGKTLPSRLLLKEDGDYANGIAAADQALATYSADYLKKIFPDMKHKTSYDWNGNGTIDASEVGMDWNQNGKIDSGYVILDGSQCLVFLLGGPGGQKGFSTNPRNPLDYASRKERIGAFYQFETARLTGGPFPKYNDPWDTPYAFFSAYGKQNGYNRYGIPGPSVGSDCAGLEPYYSSVTAAGLRTYYNSDTFQIVTAGADKTFGPGGLWGPTVAVPDAARDDMANFHSAKLGSP